MGSATTPTTVSTATMPTSMTDAEATRLGLKVYVHGGSYVSGLAPTVTLNFGGGTLTSVDHSAFVPYLMQDGTWRLKFNLSVTLSSVARTDCVLRVVGVVSVAITQTVASSTNILTSINRCRLQPSSGDFGIEHASTTTAAYYMSGDVALASKPTWAF